MMTGLLALFLLLPNNSRAIGLSVMEQTRTSNNTIFVDTRNARLDISTQSYNGKVPSVDLYTTSNVVISNTPADNCVIYATGSITCLGATLTSGSASLNNNNIWTGTNQFNSTTTFPAGSTVTFATAFTQTAGTITVTNPPIVNGQWTEIASTMPAAALSQISFAGLSSTNVFTGGVSYRLTAHWVAGGTSGQIPAIGFNGSRGTLYGYIAQNLLQGVGAQSGTASRASATSCNLWATTTVGADNQNIDIIFGPTSYGIEAKSTGNGSNSSNNEWAAGPNNCDFSNNAALSSIELIAPAGMTFTSFRAVLERLVWQ